MPPAPPTPVPGNLTVPPLFGWWEILVLLVVVLVVAVIAFLFLGAGPAASERSEWQAFLDGRSSRRERDEGTATVRAERPLAEAPADN
jgi:hypothetical protein